MSELLDPDDYIHRYTREQALNDGLLVDVSGTMREAGIVFPVALTRAVWESHVRWDQEKEEVIQDEVGRLWDVLHMAAVAMRGANSRGEPGSYLEYELFCIPQGRTQALAETLKIIVGPGDQREPVITIMHLNES